MKDSKLFLKCVKTYSSYLTEGKVYPATLESDGDGYYLTTDSDETAYQRQLTGSHADFELVQENEENSMTNTSALTPESLGCFQQVADVIGVESAREELQRVINYDNVHWRNTPTTNDLVDSFGWSSTHQGCEFWNSIDDGEIPEGFTPKSHTNCSHLSTLGDTLSEPKFGDLLHINGESVVFIRVDSDGDYEVVYQEGEVDYVNIEQIDEYAPDPYQEQRERILKRWQRRTLDNAVDTEVCRVEMRVSDLIDFVQDNLLAES